MSHVEEEKKVEEGTIDLKYLKTLTMERFLSVQGLHPAIEEALASKNITNVSDLLECDLGDITQLSKKFGKFHMEIGHKISFRKIMNVIIEEKDRLIELKKQKWILKSKQPTLILDKKQLNAVEKVVLKLSLIEKSKDKIKENIDDILASSKQSKSEIKHFFKLLREDLRDREKELIEKCEQLVNFRIEEYSKVSKNLFEFESIIRKKYEYIKDNLLMPEKDVLDEFVYLNKKQNLKLMNILDKIESHEINNQLNNSQSIKSVDIGFIRDATTIIV